MTEFLTLWDALSDQEAEVASAIHVSVVGALAMIGDDVRNMDWANSSIQDRSFERIEKAA